MMSFKDFVLKYKLKKKATSNIKVQQVLPSLSLNDVGMYLRDRPFQSDIGIVNLHPSEGTHWFCYINNRYADNYSCPPPQKLSKFVIKRYGRCLYSEYKIQSLINTRDSYCASCFSYII